MQDALKYFIQSFVRLFATGMNLSIIFLIIIFLILLSGKQNHFELLFASAYQVYSWTNLILSGFFWFAMTFYKTTFSLRADSKGPML